ncbi:DUF1566 domain-containing protein [Janthinobacterium fluminis]|uniref:DUF1566 domain-containing protein n=1 Tax=Janthinobacterium fluminis TaxID=2987524 RepID=A0ABT5JUB8_9BURK|nr:DUF1566 domain-containing protein [Janthinobacterium fluminis]MDC8756229.1 DUF1566 domain-containing protein [Janthinobacterium fluminis]
MNLNTSTIPAAIGAAFGGGFYAGRINVDGVAFALIVSPKTFGEFKGRWSPNDDNVPGAEHYADGMANTEAMAGAGSVLAAKVLQLDIGGLADWYIPSRDELELIYRNLKPSDDENSESFRSGDNPSSSPVGFPYTEALPAQTTVDAFQEGGNEALEPFWHWSSTQYAAVPSYAWIQFFDDGSQGYTLKSYEGRARAVRRLKI